MPKSSAGSSIGWNTNWKRFFVLKVSIFFRSQEGSQYVRGFGGIGGMLRYTVDFQVLVMNP
jgi:peptide chain release factor subunit 1